MDFLNEWAAEKRKKMNGMLGLLTVGFNFDRSASILHRFTFHFRSLGEVSSARSDEIT